MQMNFSWLYMVYTPVSSFALHAVLGPHAKATTSRISADLGGPFENRRNLQKLCHRSNIFSIREVGRCEPNYHATLMYSAAAIESFEVLRSPEKAVDQSFGKFASFQGSASDTSTELKSLTGNKH